MTAEDIPSETLELWANRRGLPATLDTLSLSNWREKDEHRAAVLALFQRHTFPKLQQLELLFGRSEAWERDLAAALAISCPADLRLRLPDPPRPRQTVARGEHSGHDDMPELENENGEVIEAVCEE